MSISNYEVNGKIFWKIYLNVRSKEDPTIREQKLVQGIETEKAAKTEEKKLYRELSEKLVRRASLGLTWGSVIDSWETEMKTHGSTYGYQLTTIIDHASALRRWTEKWLDKPAGNLNRGDGAEVMKRVEDFGKSFSLQRNLKHTINVVYDWGIQQRLIRGAYESPVKGYKLVRREEKVPDILTLEEIRKLLIEAKRMEHEWYPVWSMALLTGMRNGELHALLWSDVDLENRRITVSKSFHSRRRIVKSTKSGCWRTVPISDELYALLMELKAKTGKTPNVLPRFWKWDHGQQAEILRAFCIGIGIRSIKFHALRACFATQLLAHDIAPARVMKICGWQELKTMQHYIRLAGIDEKGATQVLRLLPSDDAVMGEVVNLFDFKAKKQDG